MSKPDTFTIELDQRDAALLDSSLLSRMQDAWAEEDTARLAGDTRRADELIAHARTLGDLRSRILGELTTFVEVGA